MWGQNRRPWHHVRNRPSGGMNGTLDLSDQADVYGDIRPERSPDTDEESGRYALHLVTDALPTSLARIFGLISTMDMVPESMHSTASADETICLSLTFRNTDPYKSDLLRRKISQLTETLTVTSESCQS